VGLSRSEKGRVERLGPGVEELFSFSDFITNLENTEKGKKRIIVLDDGLVSKRERLTCRKGTISEVFTQCDDG
jgi:hypothetical protein